MSGSRFGAWISAAQLGTDVQIGRTCVSHHGDYVCGTAGNAALDAFTRGVGKTSVRNGVGVLGLHPLHPLVPVRPEGCARRRRLLDPDGIAVEPW